MAAPKPHTSGIGNLKAPQPGIWGGETSDTDQSRINVSGKINTECYFQIQGGISTWGGRSQACVRTCVCACMVLHTGSSLRHLAWGWLCVRMVNRNSETGYICGSLPSESLLPMKKTAPCSGLPTKTKKQVSFLRLSQQQEGRGTAPMSRTPLLEL